MTGFNRKIKYRLYFLPFLAPFFQFFWFLFGCQFLFFEFCLFSWFFKFQNLICYGNFFNFCQFEFGWVWSERALMLSLVLKSTPGVWCRSIQFFGGVTLYSTNQSPPDLFSSTLFWGAEMSRPTPDIMAPLNTTIQNHSEPFWIFKTINYTKITQN